MPGQYQTTAAVAIGRPVKEMRTVGTNKGWGGGVGTPTPSFYITVD